MPILRFSLALYKITPGKTTILQLAMYCCYLFLLSDYIIYVEEYYNFSIDVSLSKSIVISILSVMACNNLKILKIYGNLFHKPPTFIVINTKFGEEINA
jgi:hypothetical protein